MTCAWKELLAVLPVWLRDEVNVSGEAAMEELRLRINAPPELVFSQESLWLDRRITREDLDYTVNAASRYSPWSAGSAAAGYITIKGGHRIGLCGETVFRQGSVAGFRNISSLCIRVARDFPGIAEGLGKIQGSVLILGPPGWGKTTLLRDLIRQTGKREHVCVVDERQELFWQGPSGEARVDVLSGCSKRAGIPMLLRTMGPGCIAVDEITEAEDTAALVHCANCGVRLLATAHAPSVSGFRKREVYAPLWENRVFDVFLVLNRDKSYTMERMTQWTASESVQY